MTEALKSRIKNFVVEKIKSSQNKRMSKVPDVKNESQFQELKKLSNNRRPTVLKGQSETE